MSTAPCRSLLGPSDDVGLRPASREERSARTTALLEQAHAGPDGAARVALLEEVVLINRGVAEAVAARYRGRGVDDGDLVQAAYEGLVKAVQRFDPAVRPDLLTYAVPTMRGEVRRYFRDHSWMVRPPRRIQELQWRVSRSTDRLAVELGRPPTGAEVAAASGCTLHELGEAEQASGCFHPVSLDRAATPTSEATIGDYLLDDDTTATSQIEIRDALAPLISALPGRDRRILYLRFIEHRSQAEIGAELGVTQTQVSRLLNRIFEQLRGHLE